MGFKDDDGEIGADADNHQGDQKLVATRQLCYEEDARQRSVHHTSHHAGHSQHGKIVFGYVDTNLFVIPHPCEEETSEGTEEE